MCIFGVYECEEGLTEPVDMKLVKEFKYLGDAKQWVIECTLNSKEGVWYNILIQ